LSKSRDSIDPISLNNFVPLLIFFPSSKL
jgi:hypothetical protein